MGGFNPINIIINVAQGYKALSSQNTQKGDSVQNFNGNNVNTNANNTNFRPVNYNMAAFQLSSADQKAISTMDIEQQANYVKDLLNLPRDFESFINLVQGSQNSDVRAFLELTKMLQNGKIDISKLSFLLSENSKEAANKLMATIMSVSKMGSNNVAQLKELMGILSGAGTNTGEAAQTIKNLMMLYLPWLPLSVRHDMNLDFDIDIFDKIEGPDPNKEDTNETIKIMIQTANYGNVMAELEMAKNFEIDVFIQAQESFPEKEVFEAFKKENQKTNIRANITIEKNEDKNGEYARNIQITASSFVSPKLLFACHSLIKIIIEVDSLNFIINEENE